MITLWPGFSTIFPPGTSCTPVIIMGSLLVLTFRQVLMDLSNISIHLSRIYWPRACTSNLRPGQFYARHSVLSGRLDKAVHLAVHSDEILIPDLEHIEAKGHLCPSWIGVGGRPSISLLVLLFVLHQIFLQLWTESVEHYADDERIGKILSQRGECLQK